MDDLQNYLQNANADIFEIIKWAIIVAAFDHPIEFLIKRDEIAQTLYTCDESNNCKKQQNIIDLSDNERIERGIVDEVLRIKEIIEKSGDNFESESVVCDSLKRLIEIGLSVNILEETGIGKTVSGLQKHLSKDVRENARRLLKEWKGMVDEWLEKKPKDDDLKPIFLDEGTKSSFDKESKIKIEWKEEENDSKVLVIPDEQSEAMKFESSSDIEETESKVKIEGKKVENDSKALVIPDEQSKAMKSESSSDIEEKIEETESKIKIEWKKVENDSKALVIPDEQSEAMKSELLSGIEEKIEEIESKIKVKLEKVENSPKVEVIDDEESKTIKCETGSNFMTPGSMNIVVFKGTIEKKCEEPTSKIKIKLENIANTLKVQAVPDKLNKPVKSESSTSNEEKREETKSKIKIKEEKTKNAPKARVIPDEESKASSRIEEKIEATKRKLQKGYSENMKKKRRIQMMHSDEVTQQGLPPDRGLYCRLGNVGTQPKIPGFINTEYVGKKVHQTEYGWNQTEHGWQRYKLSGYMIK